MAEKKWIKGAIKEPGALRKSMGVKEGETIPKEDLERETKKLQKQAEGDKKLPPHLRRKLRQLIMAKTLHGFK